MENMWDKVVKGCAAAFGAAASFWVGLGVLPQTLAVVMGIDYLTGLLCAWRGVSQKTENGHISSKAGFEGLLRKGGILLVVLMATWLDEATGAKVMAAATMCFYIANEGISILENTSLLGVPYPSILKKALEALKDKGEDEQGEEEEDE